MYILYEDNDFKLTCSDTLFDKYVIFCPSAAGLDQVTLDGTFRDPGKKDHLLSDTYTSLGINEINFISKTAHWYQRPGSDICEKILKEVLKGHEKQSVIYGFSMGGFGAIHFGSALGIASVAFSPQATLENVEGDLDIPEAWKKVSDYAKHYYGVFKSNIVDGINSEVPIYMFYDGCNILDRKHAIYITKHCKNCISFNIPYGGHACTGSVNRIYKVKKIINEIINNEFDPNKFKKIFFSNYNIKEHQTESAWSRFKYLYDIIPEYNFYMKLGVLRSKKYFNLCAAVCNIIEKKFPKYLDQCIECLKDDKKILKHAFNMGIMHEVDKLIENSYERKRVCALFYQNRKLYNKSEIIYRNIYNIDKHNIEIAGNLALVIQKQGRVEESLDILFKHIELNGRNEQNMAFLGKIYFLNKDYKNARKWLALSFDHTTFVGKTINIGNCILYARSFREEGHVSQAVEYLKKNLSLGKDSGDFLAYLGAFLSMLGQNDEALEFMNQAKYKQNCPDWIDIWINKALKEIKK